MNFIGYNEQAIHLKSHISGIRNINDETSIIRVMINEDKLPEYKGEIQLTVSIMPAAKCANGSTVVIGCLAFSTQSKEI